MDFFRKIFGFTSNQPTSSQEFESTTTQQPFTNQDRSGIRFDYDEKSFLNPNEQFEDAFNVFTDPIEMHRFFEEQMDQVFKMFGFPRLENFFNNIPSIEGNNHSTQTGNDSERDPDIEPTNPRDYFLKNEPIMPHYEDSTEKSDRDVDGILNIGDLNSVFKKSTDKKTYNQKKPFGETFFNQSVQVKTVRKPDGSLETRKTMRDSQGNKETIITQKQGDKEYTIIKRVDKNGKEEIEEIMVNMDEKDKPALKQSEHCESSAPFGAYFDNTMFDKFFK